MRPEQRTAVMLVLALAALGCRREQVASPQLPESPATAAVVSDEPETDVVETEPEFEFDCSSGPIELFEAPHETYDITLSADGELVAATDADGVVIWELKSGRRLHTLTGEHPGPLEQLAFSPSGGRIAAFGAETLVVWSLDDERVIRRETLYYRQEQIFYREYEGREWLIIDRGIVRANDPQPPATVIEVDGGPLLHPFEPVKRGSELALAVDALTLVRMAEPAEIWLGPGLELRKLDGALGPVAISSDGRVVVSGVPGGASVWDPQTGAKTGVLHDANADAVVSEMVFRPEAIAISPDSRRVALAYMDDRGGVLWDRESGAALATIGSPPGTDIMLDFSADGRWLLAGIDGLMNRHTGADPALMWLADAETGEGVSVDLGDFMYSLEWAKDGGLLAAGGMSTARLWCREGLRSPSSAN